jgi:hypothetical protein
VSLLESVPDPCIHEGMLSMRAWPWLTYRSVHLLGTCYLCMLDIWLVHFGSRLGYRVRIDSFCSLLLFFFLVNRMTHIGSAIVHKRFSVV